MKTVKQITLAARPKGMPDMSIFRFDDVALPEVKTGELQLKGRYYSVDPYMRGRMNDVKSYSPPFKLEHALEGGAVAEVVESKDPAFAPGDLVLGPYLPWATEMVVPAATVKKIDTNLAPASYFLGVLGMTGLTAYIGLLDIGKPKAGETLVVSGAAGAVGLVVGQLGKHLGLRVVGIAGSEDKIKMLKEEYGFDEALNYKTGDLSAQIAKACPDGVDIYFDNVGGDVTDAVVPHLNFFARIPLCGQIAIYNNEEPSVGPRIQPTLLTRSVLMQGFIIRNYPTRYAEGIQYLAPLVKAGKIKFTETFVEGFEKIPEAFLALFTGQNTGKMIVKV
ncbi:NADP-dependent oxidoreductase [Chitinophaga barathri]|uniref:NADP-dependent oxidoreductase n=1 Tax=Chitinophaga barathri TaxID=1647451 RepID=A0A3N4MDS4_9BACT|nr:NADP-dependent oxidoreductase [Chitinophaga barathri]RPD38260.1 NADP-dependent oxidoreductase [Chitinophaga barathri]